jgi:crotonobetainyl-CoA:carnitine CoA-transferase CaiB-like acyl-CoA transferase
MDVELDAASRGPLRGIQVLDLSTMVSGPLCTQILGDLGADVIKLEAPSGDTARRLGPPWKAGLSGFFVSFNRNKRSLVADLKTDAGQAIARRLALRADVLIENFRPGVAERLGLDRAALARENPKLITVAVNGFGPDGPYRDQPAYDTVIQGLSGFMAAQGGDGPPQLVKSIVADKTTALTATYAVLAALFARERDGGRGQHVAVPMLDAYAAFMLSDVITGHAFADDPPHPGLKPGVVHRTWQTADGYVVMMIIEDRQFQGVCRALGREDMIEDPRCKDLLARIQNIEELFQILEDELRKWPTAEFVERARKFGAPVSPANGLPEFLADPQVAHNRTVFEVKDPEAGTLRLLRSPVRFERTPANLRGLPPRLGEQTDAILREAGYAEEDIAAFRAAGTVA